MNMLCHSTHAGNLASIRRKGLQPRIGAAIKQSGLLDPDAAIPMVFMAEHPASLPWQVALRLGKEVRDVTLDDIHQHGLLCLVEPRPGIYLKTGEGVFEIDGDGDTVDAFDGIPVGRLPAYVEECDYFSTRPVAPARILVGDELVEVLRTHYAEYMPNNIRSDLQGGYAWGRR